MTLEKYDLPTERFIEDINQPGIDINKLSSKYEPFIDQVARDLQSSILKAPSTTGELITFRFVNRVNYLNLGEGQISRLKGFTSTSTNHTYLAGHVDAFKMVFIIPAGSQVLPFIHLDAPSGEDEILLPHGTQIVHERTLNIDHFDMVQPPRTYNSWKYDGSTQPRQDPFTRKFEDIECAKVRSFKEVYVFRVLNDPWEVQAALNYDPLKYNLYGPCLNSVSAQTEVPIETLKRISEEHLFS